MKKLVIIFVGVLICIVVGIFLIRSNDTDTQITKNKTKVGCVFIGSSSDKSWGQSHYEAMEKSAKELNLEVIYKENVPGDETCFTKIEELIKEGCKIVMCDSYSHGEWVLKAADKYPEVYFFHATGVEERDNLTTFFGRIYQMRYLSGIVAGLQTETDEIGYVAAFPIAEVNRGINAFTLGVKSVNPDAKVYVEWTNSWNDNEQCRKATEQLLRGHNIDVMTMHSDSLEPLKVADEKGVWSIGYNMDNSADYPNTYLTAPVWQWENFYEPKILECLQGKFQGKHYWEGANTGIVALAPFTGNVKTGVQEAVDKEIQRIEGGMFDVFYGPVTDTEGNVRIKAGESMSDNAMLNEFDWYVEGVVVDE